MPWSALNAVSSTPPPKLNSTTSPGIGVTVVFSGPICAKRGTIV
jgi:hypothetical protein